jgi:rubredoxin
MNTEPYKKYTCVTCGFTYDEAEGLPEEGFPPGTRFDDIPDDWTCPECSASKFDFEFLD